MLPSGVTANPQRATFAAKFQIGREHAFPTRRSADLKLVGANYRIDKSKPDGRLMLFYASEWRDGESAASYFRRQVSDWKRTRFPYTTLCRSETCRRKLSN